MSGFVSFISRLVQSATAHNTINIPTVPVTFQRSPGVPTGNDRGIANMDFRVTSLGFVLQTGRTPADGRIDVRLIGGRATLQLLHNGNPVAEYDVRARTAALEPDNTINGIQRRLRMLGYQLGHDSATQDGITNDITKLTDRAIQDFQIDQKIAFDGKVNADTTTKINDAVDALP
ncbi:MAG: peptidoglycan-binding protein [Leptolyngbya sp. PLA3]|nr:MAG: peptidoglycan-binding protein [Cyanobacteria bacterium CYA]MCE7969166.1 peptidoglycan-binding protein [Leptolyngbya sp. PL-A3]